jgi:hypothetical protein
LPASNRTTSGTTPVVGAMVSILDGAVTNTSHGRPHRAVGMQQQRAGISAPAPLRQ